MSPTNRGVVIIGHGPSPKGKKWGKRLDEWTVVRLKDWSWQISHEWTEDFGTRVDYVGASTEGMFLMVEAMRATNTKPIEYWAQPKRNFWNQELEGKARRELNAPLDIGIKIHRLWNQKFLDMGGQAPNVSLGFFAITQVCHKLKPDEIRLVGYDNMLNPNLFEYHKVHRGKWQTRHDWHMENRLLDDVEAHYGVKILPWDGATRFSLPQNADELLKKYENPSA